MANTTSEWWDLDGVSLNQYGWNITTFGGGRYDLPPRRGENITMAYRPGQVHRRKVADARVITLVMWLAAVDPATGASVTDPHTRFNDSWDFLRRTVWRADGSQVTLTRRWNLTIDGEVTTLAASGMAEISDSMSPTMTGRLRADFTMNLLMADPYFYGSQVAETLEVGQTVAVSNPGHDIAMHANLGVDLIGPLTTPRLTNLTPSPDVWVQFNDTIPDGVTVHLDVPGFTATRSDSSANVLGKVSHSGARYWIGLLPATNSLRLTASAGSGSAVVTFRPPYV